MKVKSVKVQIIITPGIIQVQGPHRYQKKTKTFNILKNIIVHLVF